MRAANIVVRMSTLASPLASPPLPLASASPGGAESGVRVQRAAGRARLTLVAPDATLRARIRGLLEGEDHEVEAVASMDEARGTLASRTPDLVVYAPADDGDVQIEQFTATAKAGLIVLTPLAGDAGVVRALDAGADDALPPPYARAELLARVRSALRRAKAKTARAERRYGDLVLDVESRELAVDDRRVTLTRLEFRLLEELMLAGGLALKHDDLLTRVWGASHRGRLNYLRVYVARLRRKIEQDPSHPRIIHSVPAVGYRLASSDAADGAPAPASSEPDELGAG
ncbi:MAG: kdpE [Labilithrix sp.]|nr:kdpE [Labilithrix sp.]